MTSKTPKNLSTTVSVLLFIFFISFYATGLETVSAVEADTYEDDDSAIQAKVFPLAIEGDTSQIAINYGILPQHHNFHDAGDEDWIKFYVVIDGLHKGWYTIKVENPESNCDAVIELYDTDGTTLLFSRDDWWEGDGEFLDWQFEEDGVYYVKVKQSDPEVFGENTGYEFVVYWPIGSPAGTGIITGLVKDQVSNEAIDGALIRTNSGGSAITAEGTYLLLHPAGTTNITVNAQGYLPSTASVTLRSGNAVSKDISLVPTGTSSTTTTTPSSSSTTTSAAASTTTTTTDAIPCLAEELYGEYSEETYLLRDFRDNVLEKTPDGKKSIMLYYRQSPSIVKLMKENEEAKNIIKTVIDGMLPAIRTKLKATATP